MYNTNANQQNSTKDTQKPKCFSPELDQKADFSRIK